MNAAEAAESLRRDLAPGPYQEMSGWAHAIPQEKRVAIVAVCSEVERLQRVAMLGIADLRAERDTAVLRAEAAEAEAERLERVARSEWDRRSRLMDRVAKARAILDPRSLEGDGS